MQSVAWLNYGWDRILLVCLLSRLVLARSYSSNLKIEIMSLLLRVTCIAIQRILFCVKNIATCWECCLVMYSNNFFCLHPYLLRNILQLTHCFNWRLAAISHQPSTLLFTDSNSRLFASLHCTALHSLTNCPAYNISARTAQKMLFLFGVQLLLIRNMLPSSGCCL
jgi:hypothetical protein